MKIGDKVRVSKRAVDIEFFKDKVGVIEDASTLRRSGGHSVSYFDVHFGEAPNDESYTFFEYELEEYELEVVPNILALASAANEAAIAYRNNPYLSYGRALCEAVDALTSAIVEEENNHG